MRIQGNTILITGGGSGIGLALARQFLHAGNTVIISGRDESKLADAQRTLGGEIITCDISKASERVKLVAHLIERFPAINIVVNNAGIMRQHDLSHDAIDMAAVEQELATNLHAPIDLCVRLLPHLRRQPSAALVNVSSGLVYSPVASTPIYAATKAGLHAFTQTVRYQLRNSTVRVFDVLPPAIDTALNAGIDTPKIPPDAVAKAVMQGMARDTAEIRIGQTKALYVASRIAPDWINRKLNETVDKATKR